MELNFQSEKSIFLQIAEQIEDAVFTGAFPEESQIPSTTEIAASFKINPATVLKGMNILVDGEIIYKKRGIGMFVCEGAVEKVKAKRQQQFFENYVAGLVAEAHKLGLSMAELVALIERGYGK